MTQPTRPPKSATVTERSGVKEGGAGGTRPRIKERRARRGPVGASKGLDATTLPRRADVLKGLRRGRTRASVASPSLRRRTGARRQTGERSEPEFNGIHFILNATKSARGQGGETGFVSKTTNPDRPPPPTFLER